MRTALFLTWPQAKQCCSDVVFVHMCVSARCELFLADVIRWTWRRGKGIPSHQDEGWTTESGKVGACLSVSCPMDMLLMGALLILVWLCLLSPPLIFSLPLPFSPSSLPLLSPLLFFLPLFTSFSNYLPQHSWIQGIRFTYSVLYSVVVLFPTTCDSGRQSGKHIWCEWPITLIHTPHILTSGTDIYGNYDAFSATGFEKCMSIFSQEMRALNPTCSCDGGSCV